MTYQHRTYQLECLPDEWIEDTYERLWKIIQHHPDNDVEYEHLVQLSKIWFYRNRLQCHYSDSIELLLRSF